MTFPPDITMIDLIGKLIGLVSGAYLCINLFFDLNAQTRRSSYDNPQIDSKSRWFSAVLSIDLFVGIFLLYIGLAEADYPFGRVISVGFGYYCFNVSVSMFQVPDSKSEATFQAQFFLLLGLFIIYISMFNPMSLTDFLDVMGGDSYVPAF